MERVHLGGRAHAELLVPAIEEVCALAGHAVTDIDAIAVDIGPGLFTGLRVGVATAKALAQALGVDLIGVGSLDILAAAAVERTGAEPTGVVAPVVDARRGEVFAAVYRFDRAHSGRRADRPGGRPHRPAPAHRPRGAGGVAGGGGDGGRPVTVVGDGAVRYRPQLSAHGVLDLEPAGELASPPPLALARLARRRLAPGRRPATPLELVPDYRRPADARINWEQRAPRSVDRPGAGDPATVSRRPNRPRPPGRWR